jgi:hypothetical protein
MLSDQIPSRTFHSALLITPSNQQDNSVKASSVPYLQKKISKLNLERPRSSPGVRLGTSGSNRLLQKSGSQDSLHVEESVSSRSRSRSHSQNSTNIQVKNVDKPDSLKLYGNGSEESLKLEPSPSENTADKSPLCPKRMDINYNAIDMLDRNTVNNGLDNPGISDSTEELIRESHLKEARLKTEVLCDKNRPSPFMRSLSYATEQEKRKNEFDNKPVSLVSVISGSCDCIDNEGKNSWEKYIVKKSRLDPELVVEDIEHLDCFPHDIQIPYPNSTPYRFSSFKSVDSLFHDSGNLETIELEYCQKGNNVQKSSHARENITEKSIRFDRKSQSVQISGLHSRNDVEIVKNRENISKSAEMLAIGHDSDCLPRIQQKNLTKDPSRDEMETSFYSGNNPQNERVSGIYRKNTKSPPKVS